MAYVLPNYRTKREFRAAVLCGVEHRPFARSGTFAIAKNGWVTVQGPHYPEVHRWYAKCDVKDGVVTRVR